MWNKKELVGRGYNLGEEGEMGSWLVFLSKTKIFFDYYRKKMLGNNTFIFSNSPKDRSTSILNRDYERIVDIAILTLNVGYLTRHI